LQVFSGLGLSQRMIQNNTGVFRYCSKQDDRLNGDATYIRTL
jgi:hypothetical protein